MAKNQKMLFSVMCVFLVFGGLLLQSVSAKTNGCSLLRGKWDEGIRSISSTIPISVFFNDGILSIHSSTQRSDITICISKDDKVFYEETVPASETDCITIGLSEFELGSYSVELKNQWGDCLYGEFWIF